MSTQLQLMCYMVYVSLFFLQSFLGWLILQLLSSYLKVLAFSLIQRKKRHRQSFTDWFLKSLLQERVPFPLSCRYPGDWLLSHPCQIRTGLGLFVLFLIWHICIRQQMHAFCRFDSVRAGLLSMLPVQVPHLLSQLPEQSSWDLQKTISWWLTGWSLNTLQWGIMTRL